jgi:hypothetical protein
VRFAAVRFAAVRFAAVSALSRIWCCLTFSNSSSVGNRMERKQELCFVLMFDVCGLV